MNYYSISLFILSAVLLFGSNVLNYYGFDERKFQLFMMVISLVPSLMYLHKWRKNYSQFVFVVFIVLFSVYKLLTDRGEGTRVLVMSIMGAPILITAFPLINQRILFYRKQFWKKAFKIFIVFYLVEVLLVLLERVIGQSVFGWAGFKNSIESIGVTDFRCTGLYGHPLYNALMVSTAMAFLLISNLKPWVKFVLWGLGYLAVLCLNSRGSIVFNPLLLGFYILYTFILKQRIADSAKIATLFSGVLVAGIAYFLITQGMLGGRLMSMGLVDDGSTQVRIDTIEFLYSASLKDFLWGMSHKQYIYLFSLNGMSATENFWVDYLLRFGLVFLVFYAVLYVVYLRKEFKRYDLFDKLYVSSAFILIASTNNSLSASFVALFYFLFLVRLFNPPTFSKIVRRKYLTKIS